MPHNTLEIGFINSSNLDELEKYINDTNQIKNYNKIINFTEHIDNITDDLITDKPIITSSDKLYEQLLYLEKYSTSKDKNKLFMDNSKPKGLFFF